MDRSLARKILVGSVQTQDGSGAFGAGQVGKNGKRGLSGGKPRVGGEQAEAMQDQSDKGHAGDPTPPEAELPDPGRVPRQNMPPQA